MLNLKMDTHNSRVFMRSDVMLLFPATRLFDSSWCIFTDKSWLLSLEHNITASSHNPCSKCCTCKNVWFQNQATCHSGKGDERTKRRRAKKVIRRAKEKINYRLKWRQARTNPIFTFLFLFLILFISALFYCNLHSPSTKTLPQSHVSLLTPSPHFWLRLKTPLFTRAPSVGWDNPFSPSF